MDRNYLSVFAGCLASILKNGGADHYDIYILHSDLEHVHMQAIEHMAPNVTFTFLYTDPGMFEGFPTSSRYPVQIYYRLAAPLLLPDHLERILYLDGDTVIINSLEELYHMDFEDNCIIGCSHTGNLLNSVNQVRLGMDKQVPYINSGVMLYNLPALRELLSLDDIRKYAAKRDLVLFLPDQDILTALYGNKVKLVDWRKYNLGEKALLQNNLDPLKVPITLDWVRDNTVIIHYYGRKKPWKPKSDQTLDVFYDENVRSKALYIVTGTMGSGKTAVSRALQQQLKNCAFLDGDWCWDSHPFINNETTRRMVIDNITHLLTNYLRCPSYDNIVFCWVLDEEDTLESIIDALPLHQVKVQTVTLMPDINILTRHLQKDIDAGLRAPDIVERSIQRIPHYRHVKTHKIRCRNKTPEVIAAEILALSKPEGSEPRAE